MSSFDNLPSNLKRTIIKSMNINSKISLRAALTNKQFHEARKQFAQTPFRQTGGGRCLNSHIKHLEGTTLSYAAKEAILKNKFKSVIPTYVVNELYPGYAGHNTLNMYVRAYGSRQLINRIPVMVNVAQNRISKRLTVNLKKTLNKLSARV
jgi:hypothetical protein